MRQQPLKYSSFLSYNPEKETIPLDEAPLKIIFLELYIPFEATAVRMQMLTKRQEVSTTEEKGTNDV